MDLRDHRLRDDAVAKNRFATTRQETKTLREIALYEQPALHVFRSERLELDAPGFREAIRGQSIAHETSQSRVIATDLDARFREFDGWSKHPRERHRAMLLE